MTEPSNHSMPVEENNQHALSSDKLPSIATKRLPNPQPRFFRIAEAVAYSGVSRTALYILIGNGAVVARKSGRATLIDRESLDRYLDGLPAAEIKAA